MLLKRVQDAAVRWVSKPTGQRAVMGFAAAVQVVVLWWTYPHGWWWVQVACLVWLAVAQWFIEASRRRWQYLRMVLDLLWNDGAVAARQLAYLNTLSVHDLRELAAWKQHHPNGVALDVDDLPPVVAGYVRATVQGMGGG